MDEKSYSNTIFKTVEIEVNMSEILKQMKEDLKSAMTIEIKYRKHGAPQGIAYNMAIAQKTVSRAIISMFPELRKKPAEGTDEDVIKLLKKYINQEKERSIYQFGYLKEKDVEDKSAAEVKKLVNDTIQELGNSLTSNHIEIAQKYLPTQATEEEIREWISENVDFSKFKNKMQAMGSIMKQFKGADGNFVKGILMSI